MHPVSEGYAHRQGSEDEEQPRDREHREREAGGRDRVRPSGPLKGGHKRPPCTGLQV